MLVDGQQRITTLYQYFLGSDDIKLGNGFRPYKEMSHEEKLNFLEYEVVVRDLGNKSIEQIKDTFQRINSTKYSLNAIEIHNARYDGELKRYAEILAAHSFFEENKIFATNDVRRMRDLVFCLTAIISIISSYFNRESDIEPFLEQYNDEFEHRDSLDKEIEGTLDFITEMGFDAKSRIWQKSDLLTAIVEIHRAIYRNKLIVKPAKLAKALKKFYSEVDNISLKVDEDVVLYRKCTSAATNDRGARIKRAEIIENIIADAAR